MVLAIAWSSEAAAHAVLTHTTPHTNASVPIAPAAVQLDFNEPVEASFGAIRLYDEQGSPIAAGELSHPEGEAESVAVEVPGPLGEGVFTVTYRVVSADGHPVSGGFSFGIGVEVRTGGVRTAPDVASLLDRADAGATVEIAYGVTRGLHYLALLILIGSGFFAFLVWRPEDRRWPLRTLLGAALLGGLTSMSGLVLQGAIGAGLGFGDALSSSVIEGSLETATGKAWAWRGVLWFLAVAATTVIGARRREWMIASVLLGGGLVATLPGGGHAANQSPEAVLVPADVIHVLGAGAWLGGLIFLLIAYWPRGPDDSASSAAGVAATSRFSRMALPAMLTLAAAGVAQAWFYLDGRPGDLFEGPYGLLLVGKIALLILIVALAAGNRRRTRALTIGTGAGPSELKRAMLAEVLIAFLIIGLTAALVREAPPAVASSGPVTRSLDVGPLRLELVIEPATTGPNDYHFYFFDAETGAQVDRVKDVTLRLTQPDREVGPISLEIPFKNAAHYELLGPALPVPGSWEVAVDVRTSKFDQHTARTTMEVRTP